MGRPKGGFVSKCLHFNEAMRRIAIDWMVVVCEKMSISDYALHLGISIFDKYLSTHVHLPREKIQETIMSSIYIASKIEDEYIATVEDFIYISANVCTQEEFIKREDKILHNLHHDLMLDTLLTVSDQLKSPLNETMKYLLDIVLMNSTILYRYDMDDIVEACEELSNSNSSTTFYSPLILKIRNLQRFEEQSSLKNIQIKHNISLVEQTENLV